MLLASGALLDTRHYQTERHQSDLKVVFKILCHFIKLREKEMTHD